MKGRRFNWIISDLLRWMIKFGLESRARLRGQRFYCEALAGRSDYNLTINCDLTVSCSCQDYDGSGHLGDLNRNSFKEVFFGPVARRFREELARGRLPIKTCARCGELRRVAKAEVRAVPPQPAVDSNPARNAPDGGAAPAGYTLLAGPEPRLPFRGMLLENTVRCNLDCLGCDRESAARIRSTKQMELAKLSRMAELVQDLGLEQLFYLNLGEPFLSPNIGPELAVLREKNPGCRIVISTNGIPLNTDAKREAAMSASHIFFSVAGVDDDMVFKYERQRSFQKAYDNMKGLVAYRDARGLSLPVIEWKYLLFNWNDHPRTIERAIQMARDINLDAIAFWPTNNPFYGYSWRFRFGKLGHVGVESWKGREVILRKKEKPRSEERGCAKI